MSNEASLEAFTLWGFSCRNRAEESDNWRAQRAWRTPCGLPQAINRS